MNNLAIITARGGSKRIPRKNIRNFLGKPIISYSIDAAIKSGLFSEVMVSTDDDEIEEISKAYGASVPFKRSVENSNDFASTVDVLLEVLGSYQKQGRNFEYACCLYPTAPFITANMLGNAHLMLKNDGYDCVFPVLPYSYPFQRALKLNQDSKVSMFYPEHLHSRSQDLEKGYHDSGQFYFFKTDVLLRKKRLFTDNSGVIILKEMQAHDIDHEEDWKVAELKFKLLIDSQQ